MADTEITEEIITASSDRGSDSNGSKPVSTANSDLPLSRVRMTTDMILLSIAIAIPFISWIYIPFGGESHWFARSGTIMAIIGIMLESRLFASKLIMYELSRLPKEGRVRPKLRYVMTKGMALLTHLVVISGAIISGYGDLIFIEVKFNS